MTELSCVLGVYSKKGQGRTGTGATAQKSQHKTYYYVTRSGVDEYNVQPLSQNHLPSGLLPSLTNQQFLINFTPEINYYEKKTIPALKSLEAKIKQGEKKFLEGVLDQSEMAFAKALLIDPDNPKANLGMGSVLCTQKNFKKLHGIFDRLFSNDEVFLEQNRKEFNNFAISLRKQLLFDDAITLYGKAIELNQQDENLHFNIARSYCEAKNYKKALLHTEKALEINPDLEWAKKLKIYILKRIEK